MWKFIKSNITQISLILIFSFLFFFRLGMTTLSSWDEAWYGAISKEINISNNWLDTKFNGKGFYDHPPLGFWLITISYKIFGANEFSTRFPSAFLGLLSIILISNIAFLLFNKKTVAFISGLILGSSVWYIIRVRSGNLDSVLVFFFLLTIYLSIKSEKKYNLFPLTLLSFAGLLLTKTLVGLSAGILILFWNYKNIFNIKNIKITLLSIFSFLLFTTPWYAYHIINYSDFINRHFFEIGLRSNQTKSYFNLSYEQPLFYIHMGIRKWYYLWIAASAYLLISLKFIKKNYLFLFLWLFVVLFPFLSSEKTELWHLIPVYLPISILISIGVFSILENIIKIINKLIRHKMVNKILINKNFISTIYIVSFLLLFFIQIKNLYSEIIPENIWIPDSVAISKDISKYNKKIFLNDDFFPQAVYYSNKNIETIGDVKEVFKKGETNFVAIIRNWVLKDLDENNLKYKILKSNGTFSIVTNN